MSQSPSMESPAEHPACSSLNAIPLSFPTKPALPSKLPDLVTGLKKAATARTMLYSNKIGILVRWDNDESDTEDDLVKMESTLDHLGVECVTFVIPSSEQLLGWSWTLKDKLFELLGPYVDSTSPSLFVFYYAGQASLRGRDLCFTSGSRSIPWSNIRLVLEIAGGVDSLVILDCCYAGYAGPENPPGNDKNIHIMAAVAAHEITPKHSTQPSFTKRLLRAAQKFEDHASFTTAEWYQQVQLEKPTDAPYATFETYNGIGTISLTFSDASPPRIYRTLPGWFEKQVLVKLTLEGQRDIVEGFSKAIRRLPPNMQVEIRDAFETDAFVFLILRMSWEGWVLWTSFVHLDFLGVTLSPPLLLISNGPSSMAPWLFPTKYSLGHSRVLV